jgi:hypothetical protein
MPQRQLGATVTPDYVGTIVLGDGSRFFTTLVSTPQIARRLQRRWLMRSLLPGGGGSYTATLVPAYADGTVAGNNASAKTWLQGRGRRQLIRPGIGLQEARLLRA